jgi:hypothetical protein
MLARFEPERELNAFIVNVTTAAWMQQTGSRAGTLRSTHWDLGLVACSLITGHQLN